MKYDVTEARKTLRPPLIFGNEEQIRARKLIERVELAKDAIRDCDYGHFYAISDNETDKVRAMELSLAMCDCVSGFDPEIRTGAAFELVREWKKR